MINLSNQLLFTCEVLMLVILQNRNGILNERVSAVTGDERLRSAPFPDSGQVLFTVRRTSIDFSIHKPERLSDCRIVLHTKT